MSTAARWGTGRDSSRELIVETKDAVGNTCAVAVRFSASSGGDDDNQDTEEPREMLELLSGLPDLWDVTVHDYSYEMGTSRFVEEAGLEATMSWVKSVTDKPVVSVGRFTSPETMLRLVRQGVVDLIGAARPSIADPFLPQKIAEGRDDEIRECIGCNICYTGDQTGTPIRCTQNPTMGEEWRKGWHPEHIPAKGSDAKILIVGGGPAGLEAAVSLGKRGYAVTLRGSTQRTWVAGSRWSRRCRGSPNGGGSVTGGSTRSTNSPTSSSTSRASSTRSRSSSFRLPTTC